MCFQAQLRGGRRVVVSPKRPISTLLNEAMVPDISNCPITVSALQHVVWSKAGCSPSCVPVYDLLATHTLINSNFFALRRSWMAKP